MERLCRWFLPAVELRVRTAGVRSRATQRGGPGGRRPPLRPGSLTRLRQLAITTCYAAAPVMIAACCTSGHHPSVMTTTDRNPGSPPGAGSAPVNHQLALGTAGTGCPVARLMPGHVSDSGGPGHTGECIPFRPSSLLRARQRRAHQRRGVAREEVPALGDQVRELRDWDPSG